MLLSLKRVWLDEASLGRLRCTLRGGLAQRCPRLPVRNASRWDRGCRLLGPGMRCFAFTPYSPGDRKRNVSARNSSEEREFSIESRQEHSNECKSREDKE